jgi:hypothetical protein
MITNPFDHYWVIGGSSAEAYQSKSNTLVASDDADYAAWVQGNGPASNVESVDDLAVVIKNSGTKLPAWLLAAKPSFIQPTPTTYSKEQLAAYAADARNRYMIGGIVVNGQPFATDPITYSSLNSAYIYTQAKTASVFSWKLPDGSFVTLNKADIAALHEASNSFGQACYACEDTTLTGIEGGTIIDLAAIDAAFAAVSNNFTGVVLSESKARHVPKKVVPK